MRGIVIDPGKAPQIVRMPDDGQALERWLGGDALLRVHPTKPASLTKDLAEELAREWAAEEVL